MLIDYALGQTGIILRVLVQQDTTGSNPGYGFTGLANTTTGLNVSTIADTESSATSYTSAGSTIQTIATLGTYAAPSASDCRLAKVDDTNLPGLVEIQLANARYAVSGAKSLVVFVTGITGMMPCRVTVPLRTVNPYDMNGGLQGLKGTTNPTAGAMPTVGTAAGQINSDSAGSVTFNNTSIATVTTVTGGATAAGLTSLQSHGDSTWATATGFATPTNITAGTITTVTNLTNAPGAGDFTAAMKTSLGTAVGTAQTGDNYARIGSTGSGLTSLAPAVTALSTANWTNARSGYLDNLNVGGNVASHADFLAINQSASKHILLVTVGQYEPGETYTVEMRTFTAADGSAVNADTTPTLTATGNVSGSLSGNLSAASNPATGVYRWTYTPGATPTLEQIRFDGSATIASSVFTLSAYSQTVDFATAVFTSTDQAHLTSIYNKLPANNIADEMLVLAAVGTPMQAGSTVVITGTTGTLDAALTAIQGYFTSLQSHGDGTWATATGFATPTNITGGTITNATNVTNLTNAPTAGDFTAAMKASLNAATPSVTVGSIGAGSITSSTFAAGAITDAAFTVPPEAAGRPATFLAMLRRAWEWVANKRERNRSTGNVELFGADGVTVLETQVQSTTGSVDQQSQGA